MADSYFFDVDSSHDFSLEEEGDAAGGRPSNHDSMKRLEELESELQTDLQTMRTEFAQVSSGRELLDDPQPQPNHDAFAPEQGHQMAAAEDPSPRQNNPRDHPTPLLLQQTKNPVMGSGRIDWSDEETLVSPNLSSSPPSRSDDGEKFENEYENPIQQKETAKNGAENPFLQEPDKSKSSAELDSPFLMNVADESADNNKTPQESAWEEKDRSWTSSLPRTNTVKSGKYSSDYNTSNSSGGSPVGDEEEGAEDDPYSIRYVAEEDPLMIVANQEGDPSKHPRKSHTNTIAGMTLFCCCLLVVAAVFLPILFLIILKEDDDDGGSASRDVPAPTLPEYSMLAIEADPGSPQGRAYQWLLEDPQLDTYSDSRFFQRFSLATLYFATRGENWTTSGNFLRYDINECEWFGEPSNACASKLNVTAISSTGATSTETATARSGHPNIFDHDKSQRRKLGKKNRARHSGTKRHRRQLQQGDGNENIPISPADKGKIHHLYLPKNNLKGSMPKELALLTALKTLDVGDNTLVGTLPEMVFAVLAQLETMNIANNVFSGALPSTLGLLGALKELDVSQNGFTSSLPSTLGLLSNLEQLDATFNQLTGTLTSALGDLSNLESLLLHQNQLEGQLPSELGLLSNLQQLEMDGNKLNGTIPTQLGGLMALEELHLFDNDLNGPIPSELGALENLEVLGLVGNALTSQLPSQLGDLSSLKELWIYDNQLSGSIPTEMGALLVGNLHSIVMYGNALTGVLPPQICELEEVQFDCEEDLSSRVLCNCNCSCEGTPLEEAYIAIMKNYTKPQQQQIVGNNNTDDVETTSDEGGTGDTDITSEEGDTVDDEDDEDGGQVSATTPSPTVGTGGDSDDVDVETQTPAENAANETKAPTTTSDTVAPDDMPFNNTASPSVLNGTQSGMAANETEADNTTESNLYNSSESAADSFEELPLFGTDITRGYESSKGLEAALTIAFKRNAKDYISQQQHQKQQDQNYASTDMGSTEEIAMPMAEAADSDVATRPEASSSGSEDVTDFETNIQEENVDEADIIKADANYIYAAFGDYIVVWNLQGEKIGQVKMPDIPVDEDLYTMPVSTEEMPEPGATAATSKQSIITPGYTWRPKPSINAMLLTDNHVVAIVSGYGDSYGKERETSALSNYRGTQIRLYEKTSSGNLTFVGKKEVNGNFVDARSMGNNVYIATTSSVNLWPHLWQPLQRWNFQGLKDEDYLEQATELAQDELIPTLARKLLEELQSDNGELPTMLKINQWLTQEIKDDENTSDSENNAGWQMLMPMQYNVVNSVGQVISFNVGADVLGADKELDISVSAFLAPNPFNTMYGTEDHLVLATSGWDWMPFIRGSEQTTYLVALAVDGATTSFVSVGSLKGHLLNQYALDIVGDELRAATTVDLNNWGWGGPIMMMVDGMAAEAIARQAPDTAVTGAVLSQSPAETKEKCGEMPPEDGDGCNTIASYSKCVAMAATGCNMIVASAACPPSFSCGDIEEGPSCPARNETCMNDKNYEQCLSLVEEGCVSIKTMESCPLQFSCSLWSEVLGDGVEEDPCPGPDSECMDDEAYKQCWGLVEEGCISIETLGEECPLIFDCLSWEEGPIIDEPDIEPMPPQSEMSRTENYMTVLNLEGDVPGAMSVKGSVQIGEKHERITAVRFFDDVAYAVTFERTDPFYVLDMSVPAVLGELKLPGFSSYLHSMNPENTLLVAVGQNATSDGRVTGFMVTVFDSTDPANPQALVSHTFGDNSEVNGGYTSSSVEWDYKSFRLVNDKLIIPLDVFYNQEWDPTTQQLIPLPVGLENFQGFAVLDVATEAITEQFRISHTREPGTCTYCTGYLPMRSFVYSGDLMTVRDSFVVSTDLETGEEVWRMRLSIDGEPADCCF
jgi:Leucine-rich repeat (LRR) protein